jgi:leader peptidase (prepilin peptidase)/N-methyltransferase
VTEKIIARVFALVLGLLVGSFLNVCIHRWPRNRSVVKPRSHCVRCRKRIAWYDNIPLLSYILLGGRCRYCHRRISPRYPLVELITGLLWFWFVHQYGATLEAAKMCVFSSILVALTFCDLEKRLLPDELTKGGMWLGFAFAPFVKMPDVTVNAVVWGLQALLRVPFNQHFMLSGRLDWVAESVFGAAVPALLLWGAAAAWSKLRGREMLGFGDVKLIAMVGAFVGLTAAMLTMWVGSIAGLGLGIVYIKATGQKLSEYELPFGTFLGLAGLAVALFWPGWFMGGGRL